MNTKRIRKLFNPTVGSPVVLDVVLDKSQAFPSDPGQGTPVMVEMKTASGKRYLDSGTYSCAIGEGELSDKGTKLSSDMVEWLMSIEPEINRFFGW